MYIRGTLSIPFVRVGHGQGVDGPQQHCNTCWSLTKHLERGIGRSAVCIIGGFLVARVNSLSSCSPHKDLSSLDSTGLGELCCGWELMSDITCALPRLTLVSSSRTTASLETDERTIASIDMSGLECGKTSSLEHISMLKEGRRGARGTIDS